MKHVLSFKFFFGRSPKRFLQAIFIVGILQFGLQIRSFAQTTQDSTSVLQQCLDLPQLQQYYPLNQNNTTKPLVIMQHGVSFSTGIAVSHNNQSLLFKSKSEIMNEQAYFLFWSFTINGASARIEFSYNYNMVTPPSASQKVIIIMEKSGNTWTITNTNIETVQL